ncbi:hypothetical protein Y033_2039 [Burkholderia pseudomallei MSHR435]|nr:hypothetical protein BG17_739 [Burkholderia pseudomallei MSHR491]KGW90484.1 hypothetical protein Y034_1643 [Burkholderia pseudomallei MSHR449]KGX76429.1 hypothetical protein Y033_2039 [Burkholderia pseudomallei MSHR435]
MRISRTVVEAAEIEALAAIGREWRERLLKQYEAAGTRATHSRLRATRSVHAALHDVKHDSAKESYLA